MHARADAKYLAKPSRERVMEFRFTGLPAAQFQPLFALGDEELAMRGMRRMIADKSPGFPCRVSLEDAVPGERVLLLNFEHQPAHSPYHSIGPIFVREAAKQTFDGANVPPVLRGRLLSARAYDANGMMTDAEVVQGADIEGTLTRLFALENTEYVHIHNAIRGCYSCRVDRP